MLDEKSGFVSVWIGNMTSAEFKRYCLEEHYSDDPEHDDVPMNPFAADMGDVFYDHDFVEGKCERRPQMIKKLLMGLSNADTFLQATVAAAEKKGISKANTAIVIYDHELKPA